MDCKCIKTNGTVKALPMAVQEVVAPAMQQAGASSVRLCDRCTATKDQMSQAPTQMPIIMQNTAGDVVQYGVILYCDKCKKFLAPGDRWFGCAHKTACKNCLYSE